MNCLIVEDDEIARLSLLKFCEKIEGIDIVAVSENVSDALEQLQSHPIDLIFLDVELPGTTGIDLVREMDDLPLIIFITAKKEYAADAFQYRDKVVDYITKPVSLPKLLNAVQKGRDMLSTPNTSQSAQDYLFVKSDGRLVRIDIEELEYIETVGDYVRFKTANSQHMVHSSLKNIDSRIDHPDMMKVHRSYIINLSKIVDIEDNSVLIGKTIIPISRAHRSKLWKRLNPL